MSEREFDYAVFTLFVGILLIIIIMVTSTALSRAC